MPIRILRRTDRIGSGRSRSQRRDGTTWQELTLRLGFLFLPEPSSCRLGARYRALDWCRIGTGLPLPPRTPGPPAPVLGLETRQLRWRRPTPGAAERQVGKRVAVVCTAGDAGPVIISADEAVRVERVAALAEAAVVGPLARLNRHMSPTVLSVAGGQVVLLGPGMFVNRGMALGLGVETTTEDFEALEAASRRAGVPAELEVTPLADPSLLHRAARVGYRPVGFRSTLLRHLPDQPTLTEVVMIKEVSDRDGLDQWQATAAEGFGDTTAGDRRISDLHTAALSRLDQTHLYVARRAERPVAVAKLAILDDVAIFGGMTTVPSSRGLGIQTEMIRFRLAAASTAGCTVARSTATPGSVSERNLLRNGFSIAYTTLTMSLTVGGAG